MEDKTTDDGVLKNEISNYDQTSASSALMHSPKLKNDLTTVFFNNFMKNGSAE